MVESIVETEIYCGGVNSGEEVAAIFISISTIKSSNVFLAAGGENNLGKREKITEITWNQTVKLL